VITGMGVLAANGTGLDEFWSTLLAGKSGIGPITLFDASDLPSRIAGEVKEFDPVKYISRESKPKRLARTTQLALASTNMAVHDAKLSQNINSGYPIHVIAGVSYSALDIIDKQMDIMKRKGPESVASHVVFTSTPQAVAGSICSYLGIATNSSTISTACAAGLDAIGAAYALIREGVTDVAIAVGADAPISPFGFASFASAGISSLMNDHPEKASRPFDVKTKTGVIAEGAGSVVIENLEHAKARGVKPYAEITGYANSNDAPNSEHASGFRESIQQALANASKRSSDLDYICAHGPGHPQLDHTESVILRDILGIHASRVPVSSIKGCTGNPLAAAGPLQTIATALCFRHNRLPPNANLTDADTGCDLDYIMTSPRHANIRCALINTHGVGGTNSSLILEAIA